MKPTENTIYRVRCANGPAFTFHVQKVDRTHATGRRGGGRAGSIPLKEIRAPGEPSGPLFEFTTGDNNA